VVVGVAVTVLVVIVDGTDRRKMEGGAPVEEQVVVCAGGLGSENFTVRVY
jgi:hypothetical protein